MAEKRVSVRLAAVGGRQVRAELEGVGEAGARGFGRLSREMEAANTRLAAFSRRVRIAAAAAVAAAAAAGVAVAATALALVTLTAEAAAADPLKSEDGRRMRRRASSIATLAPRACCAIASAARKAGARVKRERERLDVESWTRSTGSLCREEVRERSRK